MLAIIALSPNVFVGIGRGHTGMAHLYQGEGALLS